MGELKTTCIIHSLSMVSVFTVFDRDIPHECISYLGIVVV